MPYKDFSAFCDIKLFFGDPEEGLNYGFTSLPNSQCVPNSSFEDNFFLLYRRSEYAAQIELACSKIFNELMGYGPELEIIKENNEFYIASRRIKNFREGCPDLKDKNEFQNIKGLAAMFTLCYFLCETDMNSGNFGIQDTGQEKRTFRIDMAESLDYDMLRTPLELSSIKKIPYIVEQQYHGVDQEYLPQSYVSSQSFQNEKIAMIKLIANTPFSFFENIIRSTVTSNLYEHTQIMFNKSLAFAKDKETINSIKSDFSKIEAKDFDKESLINLLKNRHQQWQVLTLENNFEQDFSLADHSLFMKELALYHMNASDSEEDEEALLILLRKEEASYSRADSDLYKSYPGIEFFQSSENIRHEDATYKTAEATTPEFTN